MEGVLVTAAVIAIAGLTYSRVVRSELRKVTRDLAAARETIARLEERNAAYETANRVLIERADRFADQIIAMANHPATRPEDGSADQTALLKLFGDTIISALYGPEGEGEPANQPVNAQGTFIALGLDDEVRMDLGDDIDDYDEIDTARVHGFEMPGEIDL